MITRRQALAEGLSIRAIQVRLGTGRWEAIHRGVFRIAGTTHDWKQDVMAACLAAGTGAVASHRSAGTLHNLPGLPRWLEVTVPTDRRVRIPGVRAYRSNVWTPDDQVKLEGITLTSIARTIVDLSGIISVPRLEAIVDHGLGNRLVSRLNLEETALALRASGRQGVDPLLGLLAERPVPGRAMQPGIETLLFAVLSKHGARLPEAQFRTVLSNGSVAYLDFAYPDVLLALEGDSYRCHSTRTAWSRDHTRNEELIAAGWAILPITYHGLTTDPSGIADRVSRALEARSREHL